ncbi:MULTISPECIES: amidohydrolase [unclassified Bradyrhizobium]|uniref:amidohydrolase n=1 Tax=unclassified Bradyrhizobium TaxID=2631580 RepID=UPI002916154A|nr:MULTISPECIES: amidohydrolase [unclassified Bradyrhizobium]
MSLRDALQPGTLDQAIRIRRALHSIPELGYKELKTSAMVVECLQALGADEIQTGIGGTGVVGIIRGIKGTGTRKYVGLRAELDGLELTEQTGLAWQSQNSGCMHACGHDGHMAILLATARELSANREFSGTVCCIFQPAEEGGAGAKAMIEDGLLERFPLSSIYAIHNAPWLPIGKIAINSGAVMAAADRIEISVLGAGGHGGIPHQTRDPIVATANIISMLQNVVSRYVDPAEAAVISIGGIHGGSPLKGSMIPDRVDCVGTVRTYCTDVQSTIEKKIRDIVDHVCDAHDLTGLVTYKKLYPATINHADRAALVTSVADSLLDQDDILSNVRPSMAGEDFSFFLQKVPGAYCLIGQGADSAASLHSPSYDFDDRNIERAALLLKRIALRELAFT